MRTWRKHGSPIAIAALASFLSLVATPTFAAAQQPSAPAQTQSTQAAPAPQLTGDQPVPLTDTQMGNVNGEFAPIIIVAGIFLVWMGWRIVNGKGIPVYIPRH
jgi:hypothetical protein